MFVVVVCGGLLSNFAFRLSLSACFVLAVRATVVVFRRRDCAWRRRSVGSAEELDARLSVARSEYRHRSDAVGISTVRLVDVKGVEIARQTLVRKLAVIITRETR